MSELDLIAERSYKTYKSRLKAAERLQARQRAWNTCLLALAVATTIASIALLTDDRMYGRAGPTVLVCVSVAALVASLVIAGLNYGVRSRDMFMNYREIQRLSVEAEQLQGDSEVDAEVVRDLRDRYQALLDNSENHTSADYGRSDSKAAVSKAVRWGSSACTYVPYAALVIVSLIIWPFVAWVLRGGK